MWPILGLLLVKALFSNDTPAPPAPAPLPRPPTPPAAPPVAPPVASPTAGPPAPSPTLVAASQAANRLAAEGDGAAARAEQLAAEARARGDQLAAEQAAQAAAQARADAARARAAAEAAVAPSPGVQTIPSTHGGGGVVPVRPTPAHRATPSTQGPVTADNVRAAQALIVAQASGQGTHDTIRRGQAGMGMPTRDVDGVWGPKTVTRAAYVLGAAGEAQLPSRSPRQRAARQLAVYVATGGHDAARIRQAQAALGVRPTGVLDQPTAAAVRQELST